MFKNQSGLNWDKGTFGTNSGCHFQPLPFPPSLLRVFGFLAWVKKFFPQGSEHSQHCRVFGFSVQILVFSDDRWEIHMKDQFDSVSFLCLICRIDWFLCHRQFYLSCPLPVGIVLPGPQSVIQDFRAQAQCLPGFSFLLWKGRRDLPKIGLQKSHSLEMTKILSNRCKSFVLL